MITELAKQQETFPHWPEKKRAETEQNTCKLGSLNGFGVSSQALGLSWVDLCLHMKHPRVRSEAQVRVRSQGECLGKRDTSVRWGEVG